MSGIWLPVGGKKACHEESAESIVPGNLISMNVLRDYKKGRAEPCSWIVNERYRINK
ncbi:MAG: hypothetical protein ACFCUU_10990 [Cyclobacteriaceae bacterium]